MLYKGIAGSGGIAAGRAFLYRRQEIVIDRRPLPADAVADELERFAGAVLLAKQQLASVRAKAAADMGEENARIFDAHIMMADDPALADEVAALVRADGIGAAHALERVAAGYREMFAAMEDEYLRERAADLDDVVDRLLRNLLGLAPKGLDHLDREVVVIAAELTPSDTATLDRRLVKGIAVEGGGKTSHAAIMARTLGIPAVMGLGDITGQVADGVLVIIDGQAGTVIVAPDEGQLAAYRDKAARFERRAAELGVSAALPAVTTDGRRVELAANIGAPRDVAAVIAHGGEGVGLYRSEFLYMGKTRLPDEVEQFAAYRAVAVALAGRPVIIRTLDIGGDKETGCFALPKELNPFLGWRGIRISLAEQAMFKTQLRAILRASAYGNVRLMYPMISGLEEVRQANAALAEAKAELRAAGVAFDEDIRVGIMVEVPAAAVIADLLAPEVDFFSIGSNDLCQYTLAVDRGNERVGALYQPLHPAMLRLIRQVIEAAHRHGKFVGMCGELAGDPLATVILLGLGLDEFSMSAPSLPLVKKIIRAVSHEAAQSAATRALSLATAGEITAFAAGMLREMGIEYGQECADD